MSSLTPRARVHVVGAGLAGLSAAVALASRGVPVVLSEAARQAGIPTSGMVTIGYCRRAWGRPEEGAYEEFRSIG